MGIFSGTPPPSCPSARHCAQWAQTYLKYCLCSTKDGVALGLGLASVLSWGVAEVPQIITNYKQKSTEGLSIAFLMTWVVGDLFNLVGCFLEPATLPTQFYMALLYTITTVILTGQSIYYSHIYRLKVKKTGATGKPQKHQRGEASLREKLLGQWDEASKNNIQSGVAIPIPSSPIQVNAELFWQRHGAISPSSDYYYVSARSLSRSPVPIAGTWLGNNRQTTGASLQTNDQSESGEFAPAQSAPAAMTKNSLAVVPWISVLLGMCVLHILVGSAHTDAPNEIVIPVGRKLLVLADDHADIGSGIGSFLGWAMAVIYMGGRLPQIYLNMQRGHAENLHTIKEENEEQRRIQAHTHTAQTLKTGRGTTKPEATYSTQLVELVHRHHQSTSNRRRRRTSSKPSSEPAPYFEEPQETPAAHEADGMKPVEARRPGTNPVLLGDEQQRRPTESSHHSHLLPQIQLPTRSHLHTQLQASSRTSQRPLPSPPRPAGTETPKKTTTETRRNRAYLDGIFSPPPTPPSPTTGTLRRSKESLLAAARKHQDTPKYGMPPDMA